MSYLPELHYCCVCKEYLGPDNGDGICAECDGEEVEQDSKKFECNHCDDKKYLRLEGTNILVPCLKCNPNGKMQVVELDEWTPDEGEWS